MSIQSNTIRCGRNGAILGGVLGFSGMYGYTHLIEHVTGSDQLAFANLGNFMVACFCAFVGLIVGAILGTNSASRSDKS
jgi:hypothetical protein